MSDRLVVMRDGRIEQIGNPAMSTTNPRTCGSPHSSVRAIRFPESRVAALVHCWSSSPASSAF